MIAIVTGVLAERNDDHVVIQTDGGVGYAIAVPLGVAGRLPAPGTRLSLHTELVVKEDGWSLFGFDTPVERTVFRLLLTASGVGPKLALAILSALGPERTIRSIQARDLTALSSVTGVGKKKAERLVLEVRDKLDGVSATPVAPRAAGVDEAVRALVGLGYAPLAAEDAVRAALSAGAEASTEALVRRALRDLVR